MFEVHVACHYFTLTEEEKCEDQCEIGGQCYSYNEINPWNECQVNIANSSNNYSREAIFSNISIKGGRLLKEAINRGTVIILGNTVCHLTVDYDAYH